MLACFLELPPDLVRVGAVDSTIVHNVSLFEWIEVTPFEPLGIESNTSSYLGWVIPISNVTVSPLVSSSSTHAHALVRR